MQLQESFKLQRHEGNTGEYIDILPFCNFALIVSQTCLAPKNNCTPLQTQMMETLAIKGCVDVGQPAAVNPWKANKQQISGKTTSWTNEVTMKTSAHKPILPANLLQYRNTTLVVLVHYMNKSTDQW